MRNILVYIESRYPILKKNLVAITNDFFDKERIRGDVEVSIAIVGDRKMKEINNKYKQANQTTTVLSFALTDTRVLEKTPGFIIANDRVLRLGDVIISYPQAVERAYEDQMLVDEKIKELLIYGLNNLVGKEG